MNEDAAKLLLIAILCATGAALIIAGHDAGYWFFIGVIWVLMGIL